MQPARGNTASDVFVRASAIVAMLEASGLDEYDIKETGDAMIAIMVLRTPSPHASLTAHAENVKAIIDTALPATKPLAEPAT